MRTLLNRPVNLRNIFYVFSLLFLLPVYSFSQNNSQSVTELLAQRSSLLSSGQSTSSVDNQLNVLGHNPKAVLSITSLSNGNIQVICPVYKDFSSQNVSGMFARLSSNSPYLLSLSKNEDSNSLTGIFLAGTTNQKIAEVFTHFGYNGYEEAQY